MKYIYSLLIFIGLSGSAYADDIKGKWLCETINVEDGSGGQYVYEVSGKTLRVRHLESQFPSEYIKVYMGKTNPFVVFVEEGKGQYNTSEDVIVLRTTSRNQLHLSATVTSPDRRVKARVWYGICDRL